MGSGARNMDGNALNRLYCHFERGTHLLARLLLSLHGHNRNNKLKQFGIQFCFPSDPADLADPPDLVAGAVARNNPSMRTGGQDDESSEQTPSNHLVPTHI